MNNMISLVTAALIFISLWACPSEAKVPTEDPPEGKLHPMLAETIEQGPFSPQWASLVTHSMPTWFTSDKIGLSVHWGPYAVPGWTPRKDSPYGVAYAEWYWQWLKKNQAVRDYHKEHYGTASYDDFIDGTKNIITGETEGFFAEKFDADQWMKIAKDAGAKYFFITSKHHDGFCLWDSAYTDRNSMKMGPKRDLYGELVKAARKHKIRIGLYYSYYEWDNPAYIGEKDVAKYKGFKKLTDQDGDNNPNEYVDDFMIPQIKELIDKYHPDYLCFDGEWEHGYQYWRSRQIVAYYYNQAAKRKQEVVINDRFGQKKEGNSDTRGVYGDFSHVEHYANIDRAKPWAMWRGFGNSYGYNRNEHPGNILSDLDVIKMIIDCVSDNGNIEFNVGPKADGTFADFEMQKLKVMGQWLSINGQAIYNTQKSSIPTPANGRYTINPKTKTLYFHIYDYPEDQELTLNEIPYVITWAKFLSNIEPLKIKQKENTVTIAIPQTSPDKYIPVIALKYQ
ncbi:MAG: alpha-L-fucosidase [Phycisphaerae bacterium]|nr:alpha-L-fucosidase [Phycisphaerae bacterium]